MHRCILVVIHNNREPCTTTRQRICHFHGIPVYSSLVRAQLRPHPIGPPPSTPHQTPSPRNPPKSQFMFGSGSTPLPIRHSCHSCHSVDTPAPTSGIPACLLDLCCKSGSASSFVVFGKFEQVDPPPRSHFIVSAPGMTYPPTSAASSDASGLRNSSTGNLGCRQAGRPTPAR